jgi:cytosine/adenosine deaminase-related metal-dependent hydrolase
VLLEADWVLPVSGPPIAGGAVLVADGAIAAVGPAAELRVRFPEGTVSAFPGCVLMPGLVNAHSHLEYSAFRGFARPCGFSGWMARLLMARHKLDEEDWAAAALWGAYECARSGVTSIADTAHAGWAAARAARAAGLRARVYQELFGLDDGRIPENMAGLEAALARIESESGAGIVLERGPGMEARGPAGGAYAAAAPARGEARTAGRPGPAVEVGISPHAPYTVSARLYREAARFARRAGLRLATHVAESQAEVELLLRGTSAISRVYKAAHLWAAGRWIPPGVSPVQYVAQAGALGPETLVIHAVQVDAFDIATLAASGAAVAHCPRSNRRLRCGAAPVAEYVAAGIPVGLGTDSLASNDSLDMFVEMRSALQVSEERAALGAVPDARSQGRASGAPPADSGPGPAPLTPEAVLHMATLGGARVLAWDRLVGSLETGKRADIIAVRLRPQPAGSDGPPVTDAPRVAEEPATGLPARLVGAATAADVCMTMVDGAIIYREGSRAAVEGGGAVEPGGIPAGVESAFGHVRAKLDVRD